MRQRRKARRRRKILSKIGTVAVTFMAEVIILFLLCAEVLEAAPLSQAVGSSLKSAREEIQNQDFEEQIKKYKEEVERQKRKQLVEQASKKISEDLENAESIINKLTTTAFEEGYSEMRGEAVLDIYFSGVELEKYPELQKELSKYKEVKEALANYDAVVAGAMEKLEGMEEITDDMDMSQVVGFTADELYQILLNAKSENGILLVPSEKARDIADGIIEEIEDSPINEIFAIGVMALETGHFDSNACEKLNNFGGLTYKGELMSFDSDKEGVKAAVKCIYKNMLKNGCTAAEINKTYCETDTWAEKVLSVMRVYSSTRIVYGE